MKSAVEVLDDLLEYAIVGAASDEPHGSHGAHDSLGVASQGALDQLDDALAHGRGNLGNGAEIQEHHGRAGRGFAHANQQSSRVRVGVIDAVGEDLLAVDLDHLSRQHAAIDIHAAKRRAIGDLAARFEMRGQHAAGRAVGNDARKRAIGAAFEMAGHACALLSLGAVIEFGDHDGADLAIEILHAVVRHEIFEDAKDAAQRLEIGLNDLFDIWVLHLHRDFFAGDKAREMHLPNRSRGDGVFFEVCK